MSRKERASECASERGESNEHIDLMRLIVMQLISCTGTSHRNERLAAERNKLGLAAAASSSFSSSFIFNFFFPHLPVSVPSGFGHESEEVWQTRRQWGFSVCVSPPVSLHLLANCHIVVITVTGQKAFWGIWASQTVVIKGNRTGKHRWSYLLTQK